MPKFITLFCLLPFFVMSCSSTSENEISVTAKIIENGIQINNFSKSKIYFAIYSDKSLSAIHWNPIYGDNGIDPNSSKKYDLINNDGDDYTVYYWFKSDDKDDDGIADQVRLITINFSDVVNHEVTTVIIGSRETPDPVLLEVLKLEKRGVLSDVEIMESFPIQIKLTTTKNIIDYLL